MLLPLKKVVFDVDDILWPLNRRVAAIANVNYNSIITYGISDNPLLSYEEKERIISVYNDDSIFENINWYPEVSLIDTINANVHINSNSLTECAANLKREQLHQVVSIPDNNIRMNIIVDAMRKKIDDDTFIFVDDSPYNLITSPAKYNITLNCPWNTSESAIQLLKQHNKVVIRCNSLGEIIVKIKELIA